MTDNHTAEGANGLIKQGGTARRAAVQKMVESLGGRLEVFYFAFGEKDVYLIFDVPDNPTAAAISLAVAGTGAIRMKTIVLLTSWLFTLIATRSSSRNSHSSSNSNRRLQQLLQIAILDLAEPFS